MASEIANALQQADSNSSFYVLLDEVQDVSGWERIVRQLHTRPNTDVYITGSNAYVLSSDLVTLIGGRYVELKVQPLTFAEFLQFANAYNVAFSTEDAAFADYLRYGGMPTLFHLEERTQEQMAQLLRTVYETVILNDVAARTNVSDLDLLSGFVFVVLRSCWIFAASVDAHGNKVFC